jgi:hypothetical protein
MIYKVTLKMDEENIKELEDIFDEYDIEYELNEIYEEV